jgi:hypothetical protein
MISPELYVVQETLVFGFKFSFVLLSFFLQLVQEI